MAPTVINKDLSSTSGKNTDKERPKRDTKLIIQPLDDSLPNYGKMFIF
jgi:hypothetical protein